MGALLSFLAALSLDAPPGEALASWLDTRWSGPPACVQTERIAEAAETMLGPSVEPRPTILRLSAERSDGTFVVSMQASTRDVDIERTLVGSDCASLTQAVALVLAVGIDPIAVVIHTPAPATLGSRSVVPPAPAASTPPTGERSEAGLEHEPAPGPRRDRGPGPRAILGATIAGEIGALPLVAASVHVDTGVAWRRARMGVSARVSAGPDARTDAGISGRFRLFAAALYGCPTLRRGAAIVDVCGGIEVGDLRATGRGVARPSTVDALWAAPLLAVRPGWVASRRFHVVGLVELLFVVDRHRFVADADVLIHTVGAVVARVGLGFAFRLP